MAKSFYMKLSARNLIRGRRLYAPYCVASAIMSGMVFIILNLVFNRSIANLQYGGTVQAMFTVGIVVMILFTVGYMLYLNSFLIKRRMKEFGLYAVLGMEKRHVGRLILWENTMLSGTSLLLGLVGGAVFGRLVFMLLMHVLDTAQGSQFTLSWAALLVTAAIFFGIFVLTTLYNLAHVRLANPIDLLKGQKKGEKPVRFAPFLTLLGLLMLGTAYYLAITVGNPSLALLAFWPAVILVIIATWLLFTGGSSFFLNRLRRNKKIYYKPGNFILISGLIHRMKQNAAGLANICILSTMVMVTISCCCALYLGQETILAQQNPFDVIFRLQTEQPEQQDVALDGIEQKARELADEEGITLVEPVRYHYFSQNVIVWDGKLIYNHQLDDDDLEIGDGLFLTYRSLSIIPLEDYIRLTGDVRTLAPNEVILLSESETFDTIPDGGEGLQVVHTFADTLFSRESTAVISDMQRIGVVVDSQETADRLAHAMNPNIESASYTSYLGLNIDDVNNEEGLAYARTLRDAFERAVGRLRDENQGQRVSSYSSDIYANRNESMGTYGGLLFLGVFFAILFLTNTVLILYFKQISEGYEDSERFAILQKVGLSDQEVRGTINRQMLTVFAMPLVVALIHIAAASNLIRWMLSLFMLTDFRLTLMCILVTVLLFVAVYLIVWRLTTRTYYRLVKW